MVKVKTRKVDHFSGHPRIRVTWSDEQGKHTHNVPVSYFAAYSEKHQTAIREVFPGAGIVLYSEGPGQWPTRVWEVTPAN